LNFNRRLFLKLLGAASAVAACAKTSDGDQSNEALVHDGDEFDFIVIGSGAGGGPIAANLAKADFRVLLLEAGSDQGSLTSYQVPSFHAKSSEDPNMTWEFFVKHYSDEQRQQRDSKFQDFSAEEPNKKGVLYPRAGTLGGCTSHNAMITVYPHESDWNDIADMTGDGTWHADNMRKYWALAERCEYLADASDDAKVGHGFEGWLRTNLANPKILLDTLDARLLAVIKAAAVSFGSGDVAIFNDLGGVIRDPARVLELPRVLKQIFDEVVGLLTRDVNNASAGRDQAEGLYAIPLATDKRVRNGTREYLLSTAAQYPDHLFIETEALASRILFADDRDGGKLRANGVEFMKGAKLYRADKQPADAPEQAQRVRAVAKREVIVAAGAYNTPQLLMLSGIGPAAQIGREGSIVSLEGDAKNRGVKVMKNLEGVGNNLQDRYEVGVVTRTGKPFNIIEKCTFGLSTTETHFRIEVRRGRFGIPVPVPVIAEDIVPDPCLSDWQNGAGPYVSNGAVCSIIKKSSVAEGNPDLIMFCLPGAFRGYYRGYANELFGGVTAPDKTTYTWAILKGHTRNNAGTVTMRTGNPWDTPEINFRYFDEGTGGDKDLQALIDGVDFVRLINDNAKPVLGLFGDTAEQLPGRDVDVANFVKDNAWGHHASCTCPIGTEENGGVLDSNLIVHGTANLRVVDASVFPKIPGFFIVSSIYTVSEKATDDALEAAGKPRRIPRPA
jgi:choline dehydrogenase